MIWSREALATLAEEDLCIQVLVPLFESMGYHDVFYHHGGAAEHGKDITMWKSDAVTGRLNYAVVAKAIDIKGGAQARILQTAQVQVSQCFGTPYYDQQTGEPRHVAHCILVTSRRFPKESRHALRAALSESNRNHLTTLDGADLWQHIEHNLAQKLILSHFQSGAQQLANAHPDWGFHVSLQGTESAFQLVPKTPQAKPIDVVLDLSFPETQAGLSAKAAYERHKETGDPVTLDGSMIKDFQVPDFLRVLMPQGHAFELTLGGGRQLPQPFVTTVHVRAPSGSSLSIPHIEFSLIQAGTEEISITNEPQNTPFHFTLIFRKGGKGTLNLKYTSQGRNMFRLWEIMQLQILLAEGATFSFYRAETGLPLISGFVREGHRPTNGLLLLVEKVLEIQRLTGVLVDAPDESGFSDEDLREITSVYNVVTTGRHPIELITLVSKPGVAFKSTEMPPNVIDDLVFRRSHSSLPLLGKEIHLGPVEVRCRRATIHPDDCKLLEVSRESEVQFRVIPIEGESMQARYLNWPRKGKETGLWSIANMRAAPVDSRSRRKKGRRR